MSNTHEISKMVGVYKKLFLGLGFITALGIIVAYTPLPISMTIILAVLIIVVKSKIVVDSFKDLITPRRFILVIFLLTAVMFLVVLLLPLFTQQNTLLGTLDTSKELQAEQKAIEGHPHGN